MEGFLFILLVGGFILEVYLIHQDYTTPISAKVTRYLLVEKSVKRTAMIRTIIVNGAGEHEEEHEYGPERIEHHWEQQGESFVVANYLDFIRGKEIISNTYRKIETEHFVLELFVDNPRNVWRLKHMYGSFHSILKALSNVVLNGCSLLLAPFMLLPGTPIGHLMIQIMESIFDTFIALLKFFLLFSNHLINIFSHYISLTTK